MELNLDIYILRHAFSKYNKAFSLLLEQDRLKYKLKHRYNKELINCDIAEEGIKECNKFIDENKFNNEIKNIKYIFISPFYRCIKTLKKLKKLFIDKKIIIMPLLSELFCGVCDFLDDKNIKEELKDFNVDYRYYDYLKNKYGHHFNIFLCKKTKIISEFIEIIKDKNKLYLKEFFDMIDKNKIQNLETIESLFERSIKFKEYLKNFILKNSVDSNEILLISHSYILKSFNATKINNDKFDKNICIQNCKLNKIKVIL